MKGHIYFHSPCFDGIASSVIALDFLASRREWDNPELHSVNYHLRSEWLSLKLEHPCAVIDFLYHPQSIFWADHHLTTFLSEEVKQHYQARKSKDLIYNNNAESCASLLWNYLKREYKHRNPLYADLVKWADKIDAARYDSVDEAINGSAPALRISLSMGIGDTEEYTTSLVRALRKNTLDEVAEFPEVQSKFDQVQKLYDEGLKRFSASARLENDGIVVFDVDTTGVKINRYAPYYYFRDARYSIGLVRSKNSARITAMRNPWLEFDSIPLGPIFEVWGGGGHQRVGSVVLTGERVSEARAVLEQILSRMRLEDRKASKINKAES